MNCDYDEVYKHVDHIYHDDNNQDNYMMMIILIVIIMKDKDLNDYKSFKL